MFKFFNKKEKEKEIYKIAFCDENNLATKFGEYGTICETYEKADHIIRMGWQKESKEKINDGYKIKDAWLVIEKVVDKNQNSCYNKIIKRKGDQK